MSATRSITFLNRLMAGLTICAHTLSGAQVPIKTEWHAVMSPYLQRPLWTDSQAYDAAHSLLIPIHAAFSLGMVGWQDELASHFSRFVAEADGLASGDLPRLQYLFVASYFAAEASEHGRKDLIPKGLLGLLESMFETSWASAPAWEWAHTPFNGIRARILWKLSHPKTPWRYYQVLIDQDFYPLGLAANLRRIANTGLINEKKEVGDALGVAKRIFAQEVSWQVDGGWLLQPGYWSDHPDYLYAGQAAKTPGMSPCPVPDIAWDSAHFSRFPALLTSLRRAYSFAEPEFRFYDQLVKGLEIQFFVHVAEPPSKDFPTWRLKNFMDGRNGIFRWQYPSLGPGQGYGPFEDSVVLTLGWWSLLGTKRIRTIYSDLLPLLQSDRVVQALYHGPTPITHPIRPSALQPSLPGNRLRIFIVTLASKI
ncbi:MAG: hypothetical protein IPP74_15305 [Alphaproteobacteria bacterium]|nr:hypothetical protein [Alphaproteobacteria bacterium]